jgi:polygalacturonase
MRMMNGKVMGLVSGRYWLSILTMLLLGCCKNQPGDLTGNKRYDVTTFGAVGDSITINTIAIQQAIDQCFADGGGTVLIPEGCFSSGALFLKEDVNLELSERAKLRAIAGLKNYPELENTRIAGIEMNWPAAFINVIGVKNVKISGAGTIDGSGYYWWETYWVKRDSLAKTVSGDLIDWYVPRPRLMLIHNAADVKLDGVRLRNAAFWTVHICYSESVQVTNVDIVNPVLETGKKAASSDGIDVDSSRDILIRNCSVSVDDDCIAVKSGRGSDGLRVNIPTENVMIEKCTFLAGHGGVSIGTETAGGIRNVYVRGCIARGNKVPIKFKPRPGRGGVIENIVYEDWKIEDAETVIDYAFRKVDGKTYTDEWQKIDVPFEKATPRYRNITLRNIQATASKRSISFLGWPLAHAENIIMENIAIESDSGAQFQYIDNLLLKDVSIKTADEPMRFKEILTTPKPGI